MLPRLQTDSRRIPEKLALVGCIREHLFDEQQLACLLLEMLRQHRPDRLAQLLRSRFSLQPTTGTSSAQSDLAWMRAERADSLLDCIARVSAPLLPGGRANLPAAAASLLRRYRAGGLGPFTLELDDNSEPAATGDQVDDGGTPASKPRVLI
jgi:ribosome biogenesis GTPase A